MVHLPCVSPCLTTLSRLSITTLHPRKSLETRGRRGRRDSSVLRRLSAPPLAIGRGLGRHVTRSHRLTPFRRNVAATPSLLFSLADGKRRRMEGREGKHEASVGGKLCAGKRGMPRKERRTHTQAQPAS